MSPVLNLIAAALAGAGLGLVYFGGLWMVVRKLSKWRHPVPVLITSFVVRTAVVVLGFYVVMDGQWERALALLAGFLLARIVLSSQLRPARETASTPAEEATTP